MWRKLEPKLFEEDDGPEEGPWPLREGVFLAGGVEAARALPIA